MKLKTVNDDEGNHWIESVDYFGSRESAQIAIESLTRKLALADIAVRAVQELNKINQKHSFDPVGTSAIVKEYLSKGGEL